MAGSQEARDGIQHTLQNVANRRGFSPEGDVSCIMAEALLAVLSVTVRWVDETSTSLPVLSTDKAIGDIQDAILGVLAKTTPGRPLSAAVMAKESPGQDRPGA
jgi:hypothetical protein